MQGDVGRCREISQRLVRDVQVEHGSNANPKPNPNPEQVEHGSNARPAEDFHEHAYIFHYTYGEGQA